MFIIAFLIENPKYYTLQLPMKQAFKLLLDLDNSFEALIDLLYFKHGSLVLPDIFRSQFSPRNMGTAVRTTTNKDFPHFTAFGTGFPNKDTISEATASRPALDEKEIPKPLIPSQEISAQVTENPEPAEKQSDPLRIEEQSSIPPAPPQSVPAPAPLPAEEKNDKDKYEFDF